MTTARRRLDASAPVTVLTWAAIGSATVAAVMVGLGALVSGSPGAYGSLTGGLIVLVIFWAGTAALSAMASRSADIALMMALVTYTGQVMVVFVAFIGLSASGLLDDGTLSRGWLAASVVAGALVWSAAQVWVASKARIPLYDLPDRDLEEADR